MKIITYLWFDDQAEDAAQYYTSIFSSAETGGTLEYMTETPSDKPRGSVMTVSFELYGLPFVALNGGPQFKFNPSISFIIRCESIDEVDGIWQQLSQDATVLMPLGKYPFCDWYGWLQDKYGVSWQLFLVDNMPITQKIVPQMMFVGDQCGRAEEAMEFYVSVFEDSSIDGITRHGGNAAPDREGTIQHAEFRLENQEFAVIDSAYDHRFQFNEAISFMRHCRDQEEIDYYWEKLSAEGSAEQCGWLKDQFGVSWQIVPASLEMMLSDADTTKAERVMQAVLGMKKIDIATLQQIIEAN